MTWRAQTAWGLMTALALLITAIAGRYLTLDATLFFPEQRAVYQATTQLLLVHVIGGMTALAIGPFQFLPRLRQRFPGGHRLLGRLYVAAIAVGGLSGLALARVAYGGLVSTAGFASLAVLWLVTGWLAVSSIRRGDVAAHRRWMVRSMSLTLAAVSLRLLLVPLTLGGLTFVDAYRTVAWLCWVPNLILAEGFLSRSTSSTTAATSTM